MFSGCASVRPSCSGEPDTVSHGREFLQICYKHSLGRDSVCVALIPSVFVTSSFGGLILDKTVKDPNFKGMAVFTPVINGKLIGP